MKNKSSNNKKKSDCVIRTIALSITFAVLIITLFIAVYSLTWGRYDEDLKDIVTKTLIPLWGTWIGTVLAFYFGKDNFDAASKSYQDTIDKLTSEDEKLEKIKVADCMIKTGIWCSSLKEIEEKEISKILKENKEGRFIIVDDNKVVQHVIHRSIIERFIALVALRDPELLTKVDIENNNDESTDEKEEVKECDGIVEENVENGSKVKNAAKESDLTKEVKFRHFLNCTDYRISDFKGEKGFAVVSVHSNLLEAKKAMEANKCQDIIVTENGDKNKKIEGWITNNAIIEAAK